DRAIEFGKDEQQDTESTKSKSKQIAADESSVGSPGPATDDVEFEVPAEEDDAIPIMGAANTNLLDRLLYKGVLPRYAFPTDVATFYVFDLGNTRGPLPAFRFTPSQGLAIALSQYAPGKEVWIANKRYTSGALYSPIKG